MTAISLFLSVRVVMMIVGTRMVVIMSMPCMLPAKPPRARKKQGR